MIVALIIAAASYCPDYNEKYYQCCYDFICLNGVACKENCPIKSNSLMTPAVFVFIWFVVLCAHVNLLLYVYRTDFPDINLLADKRWLISFAKVHLPLFVAFIALWGFCYSSINSMGLIVGVIGLILLGLFGLFLFIKYNSKSKFPSTGDDEQERKNIRQKKDVLDALVNGVVSSFKTIEFPDTPMQIGRPVKIIAKIKELHGIYANDLLVEFNFQNYVFEESESFVYGIEYDEATLKWTSGIMRFLCLFCIKDWVRYNRELGNDYTITVRYVQNNYGYSIHDKSDVNAPYTERYMYSIVTDKDKLLMERLDTQFIFPDVPYNENEFGKQFLSSECKKGYVPPDTHPYADDEIEQEAREMPSKLNQMRFYGNYNFRVCYDCDELKCFKCHNRPLHEECNVKVCGDCYVRHAPRNGFCMLCKNKKEPRYLHQACLCTKCYMNYNDGKCELDEYHNQ